MVLEGTRVDFVFMGKKVGGLKHPPPYLIAENGIVTRTRDATRLISQPENPLQRPHNSAPHCVSFLTIRESVLVFKFRQAPHFLRSQRTVKHGHTANPSGKSHTFATVNHPSNRKRPAAFGIRRRIISYGNHHGLSLIVTQIPFSNRKLAVRPFFQLHRQTRVLELLQFNAFIRRFTEHLHGNRSVWVDYKTGPWDTPDLSRIRGTRPVQLAL